MSDAPSPRRVGALILLTFFVGTCSAATSLEKARAVWTPESAAENAQHYCDAVLQGLSRGGIPAAAQPHAEALRKDVAAIAAERRPLRAALALTALVVGLLVSASAAGTMRRREWGIPWLLRATSVGILFGILELGLSARLDLEQARLLGRHAPAILRAADPGARILTVVSDLPRLFRYALVVPPLLMALAKLGLYAAVAISLRRFVHSHKATSDEHLG